MAVTFANASNVQPLVNAEVVVATIAGPLDNLDAYVSGGAWADGTIVFFIYATVGAVRAKVAVGIFGGPTAARITWKDPSGEPIEGSVHAGGTSYDLVVFAQPNQSYQPATPGKIAATFAGVDGGDVAADANVSGTAAVGNTIATAAGYNQFADVSARMAGLPGATFQLLASCGGGSVEAVVETAQTGGPDATAVVMKGVVLPVATSYRIVALPVQPGTSFSVTASLSTYFESAANAPGAVVLAGNTNGPSGNNTDQFFTVSRTDLDFDVGASAHPTGFNFVGMNGLTAPRTVLLNAAPADGDTIIVKDQDGSLATENIIIDGNGKTIDGSATVTMTSGNPGAFGSFLLVYRGAQNEWFISADHALSTSLIELVFTASATNVLAGVAGLPTSGIVSIDVEGFGGTGGGGGGEGGAVAGGGEPGGGGSGGTVYCKGSFDFDLSHRLDVTIGAGGAVGAAGAGGSGAGGDGTDGNPSTIKDFTSGVIKAAFAGSSGGQGATGATGGLGGANFEGNQHLASSVGFLAAGGIGGAAASAGVAGNRRDISFEIGAGSSEHVGGLGGASGVGQGGGGGGGGAGPFADGSVGGAASALNGSAGADAFPNSGAGAGGGAGGATGAGTGGTGGKGSDGFVKLQILTTTRILSPVLLRGLLAWYRADKGVTVAGGGVSVWANSSGAVDANRNALQATLALRPTLNAIDAAFNNKPTLSFSGTQWLQTGIWSSAPSQPVSIFVVGDDAGVNGQAYYDGLALDQMELLSVFGAYSPRAGNLGAGTTPLEAIPHVLGDIFNTTGSIIYQSARTPQATNVDVGVFNATGMTIGASGDTATRFLTGKIAEIVVVKGVMSKAEIDLLMDYFADRYALAIGP